MLDFNDFNAGPPHKLFFLIDRLMFTRVSRTSPLREIPSGGIIKFFDFSTLFRTSWILNMLFVNPLSLILLQDTNCFIVTINTRDWSIGLFNWSIPYLIDQSHVLRLLLFNWLVSMEFIIRFKGASSPLTACAPHACARPALDQPSEFLLFYFIYIIAFTFKYNYEASAQKSQHTLSKDARK
jgi:hypothetical protein